LIRKNDKKKTVVRQFARRTLGAATHTKNAVRKINRAIGFDREVIRAAEAFPLVAIGEDGASSILGIERKLVGPDQKNGEPAADGLVPDIANILAGVTALLEENGKRIAG
jgi:hypothetical protein